MYFSEFAVTLLNAVCYTLDVMIYTGVCQAISWLPNKLQYYLYKGMFTVETYGAREKGECVYLLNHSHPISDRILFSGELTTCVITSDIPTAIREAKERGIPIQTVISYQSRYYFDKEWVYPQPYEMVYEYGKVDETKEVTEVRGEDYREYFLQKLSSRPGTRLYRPDMEESKLLFLALLCSNFSGLLVYLLLRYQWYNRACFGGLLLIAIAWNVVC